MKDEIGYTSFGRNRSSGGGRSPSWEREWHGKGSSSRRGERDLLDFSDEHYERLFGLLGSGGSPTSSRGNGSRREKGGDAEAMAEGYYSPSPPRLNLSENNPGDAIFWSEEAYIDDPLSVGASVTSQGVITVRLNFGIQVDITSNKGIRVVNHRSHIIVAISSDGSTAALIHPSGKVYAYGSRVEISTTDCNGNNKFAKMFYKGVSFTSDSSALTYLVDQAGTRTTSDNFSDLNGDFSVPVFLSDAAYGQTYIRECGKLLKQAQFWYSEEGIENWVINGIRISQTADGLVRVGRGTSRFQIRTSPMNGTVTLTTPVIHTTASVGVPTPNMSSAGPHLFVKRGERRLHSDGLTFIVRNAGHAAGFDECNQLKVY